MKEENIRIIKDSEDYKKDLNNLLANFNEIFKDRVEKGDKHFMFIICTDKMCCVQAVATELGKIALSTVIIERLCAIIDDI